jgi:hypothetical protein
VDLSSLHGGVDLGCASVTHAVPIGRLASLFDDGVRGVEHDHPTPFDAAHTFDQYPTTAVDPTEAAATGEHGDRLPAAIADRHLERRRSGAGHDLKTLDLSGEQNRRAGGRV